MEWRTWSERLKSELRLDSEPVAVTFAGAAAAAGRAAHGKVSVCQALRRASQGEFIAITVETCGCPGGLVSLGLGQTPAAGRERLVDFLVNKEKVYCSRLAIHRGQQTVAAPVGVATHVFFAPLAQADVLPDLVAFIGRAGTLHRVIGLASYWDGGSIKAELTGPACRTGITYPAVTGEIGVSLLDFGARRLARFGADELLVSVPFHRMIHVMHALEEGAGGAAEEALEQVERQIEELGPVEAV
ncbi:MAG TPA: DUF169 domain-containing protein [Thermoanaerobaculaceae bacterium]|nr:DUF169 domain-containing protein [Thermoanaerobaculaceae bacterium]